MSHCVDIAADTQYIAELTPVVTRCEFVHGFLTPWAIIEMLDEAPFIVDADGPIQQVVFACSDIFTCELHGWLFSFTACFEEVGRVERGTNGGVAGWTGSTFKQSTQMLNREVRP